VRAIAALAGPSPSIRANANRCPPSSTTAMLHFTPIAAAFFLAASSAASAPARFNCTRSRVTSGFCSFAGMGDELATSLANTSEIRERRMTYFRVETESSSHWRGVEATLTGRNLGHAEPLGRCFKVHVFQVRVGHCGVDRLASVGVYPENNTDGMTNCTTHRADPISGLMPTPTVRVCPSTKSLYVP